MRLGKETNMTIIKCKLTPKTRVLKVYDELATSEGGRWVTAEKVYRFETCLELRKALWATPAGTAIVVEV